jgi:putative ABC transport system permease protein
MERFRQNLKFAVRNLVRNPGFAVTVLATVSLGTGITVAMFSVVDATLLRPLPYPNSDRLVSLNVIDPKFGALAFPPPYLDDLRSRMSGLDGIAGYSPSWTHTLTGLGEPRIVTTAYVTDRLFELLGATAITGRAFTPEEYRIGGPAVALVSRTFWGRYFGTAPLNGQTVRLSDQPVTIVGILERDFRLPVVSSSVSADSSIAELWMPFSANPYAALRMIPVMNVVGRLAPGIGVDQLNHEAETVAASLAADYPETSRGWRINATILQDFSARGIRGTIVVLFVAVGLLLLIACANVANLLLARGTARRHELAVRRSLGAGRRQIVEQLFIESFLISVLGSAAGLMLAAWAIRLIPSLGLAGLPPTAVVRMDWRVSAFAAFVAVLASLIFGLAPALKFSRASGEAFLREGGRTASDRSGRRLRDVLVVGEIALALLLLIGAGLLARSYWELSHVDPGFRAGGVLTLPLSLPSTAYRTDAERRAFFGGLLDRLASMPGVRSVAAVNRTPLGGNVLVPVEIQGRAGETTVDRRVSTPGYFRTIGIPVTEGRDFEVGDLPDSDKVGIVNATAAMRFWPGESALGKRFRLILRSGPGPWVRVVGVVGDVRHHGLDQAVEPEVYVPYEHAAVESMVVMLRTDAVPAAVIPLLRDAVWSMDRNLPLDRIQMLEDVVYASVNEPRARMLFLNGFAALALLLAAIGLYGVISYSVARRRRDIGIRLALGAKPEDVLRLVVGQGLLLAAAGVAIGLLGALMLVRSLSAFLFGVTPADPLTLAGVTAILLIISAIASYVPARRATRIDPVEVLRAE